MALRKDEAKWSCKVIFAIIWGVLLGSATIEQTHYNKCKSQDFKPESLCGVEKKLDGLKK